MRFSDSIDIVLATSFLQVWFLWKFVCHKGHRDEKEQGQSGNFCCILHTILVWYFAPCLGGLMVSTSNLYYDLGIC
jgi:hypothetical protein